MDLVYSVRSRRKTVSMNFEGDARENYRQDDELLSRLREKSLVFRP